MFSLLDSHSKYKFNKLDIRQPAVSLSACMQKNLCSDKNILKKPKEVVGSVQYD